MDALDLRILATMGSSEWPPDAQHPDALKPSHIAKVLGVTQETVKDRLRKMERTGVLNGYDAYPNLRHLGLEATAYIFHAQEAAKPGIVDKAKHVDGVVGTADFLGPFFLIVFAHRTDADARRRLALLSAITGDAAPRIIFRTAMPAVERPLTNLDWRIVHALRRRALRPTAEAAREVGVSQRTVKRRVDRMVSEGSLFFAPLAELSRVTGIIPFDLFCVLDPSAGKAPVNALRATFKERLLGSYTFSTDTVHYANHTVFADSMAEIEDLQRKAAGLPGVLRVHVAINKGTTETAWLDEAIELRMKETAT